MMQSYTFSSHKPKMILTSMAAGLTSVEKTGKIGDQIIQSKTLIRYVRGLYIYSNMWRRSSFFPRSRTRGIVSALLMLIHIDVSYEIPGIHSDVVVVAVVWARLLGMPCSARPRPVQISRGLTLFLTQIATEPARCTNREQ